MNEDQLKSKFIELIEANQGILHKVAHMYCSDTEEKSDIVQDILVQLWTAFPKFRGDSKVSSWIYRIALNTAINRIRKVSKKSKTQKLDITHFNLQDDNEYNEKEQLKQLVQKAVSRLNKAEKALIILYMNDYQYNEISEIIGITQSNVGVKINRIKKKLKIIINRLQNGI